MKGRPVRFQMLRLAAMILALVCTPPLPAADKAHPNLVFILTDDQSSWSIGAYGNRDSRTPNMDRLAREGARFLNAFVCTPVCSPSRAAILTGRYGTQLGLTDYISAKESKGGLGLNPTVKTWPKLLRQRGYTTGLAGKWHLGGQPQLHPHAFGFDFFTGALGGAFAAKDPELEVGGQLKKLTGFSADVVMDAALGFIETNRTQLFALLIHFREPHTPYAPVAEEDASLFRDLDPAIPLVPGLKTNQVKNWTRQYYGAVHAVDRNLGRLLAKLDEWNLAGQTAIIFTSDHGYMIGHHGMHMKGNGRMALEGTDSTTRPNMFEASIRVPLLVRWPGRVKAGREVGEMVSNIDTYASVLGLLGFKLPGGWKQEGRDWSKLLLGGRYTPHEAIFGQYDLHHDAVGWLRMIRTPDWKLIRNYVADTPDELYDLKNDPGETRNLYDDPGHEKTRRQLQERLNAWRRQIRDPLLEKQ